MNKHQPDPKNQRGMSLIEIILIIVMLGIVILPLTRLSRANLNNLVTFSIAEKAQYDIQSLMEEIIADFRATATGYDDVKTNWSGRTGTTNSGKYNYSVSFSADLVQNGITYSVVTVTVSGGGLANNMVLTTWISKE